MLDLQVTLVIAEDFTSSLASILHLEPQTSWENVEESEPVVVCLHVDRQKTLCFMFSNETAMPAAKAT